MVGQGVYSGREVAGPSLAYAAPTTGAQLGRALRKLPVDTCQKPSRWWKEKVSDFGRRRCLYKGGDVRTS